MKKHLLVIVVTGMMALLNLQIMAQVSVGNNGPGVAGQYVGWNVATAIPLSIKTEFNQPINFHTNTGAGGFGNLRMNIQSPSGFVGIGPNAVLANVFRLGVDDNIDLKISFTTPGSAGFGYRINGDKILSNPRGPAATNENIFAGVNAGAAWSAVNSYSHCTFVGEGAGQVNTKLICFLT